MGWHIGWMIVLMGCLAAAWAPAEEAPVAAAAPALPGAGPAEGDSADFLVISLMIAEVDVGKLREMGVDVPWNLAHGAAPRPFIDALQQQGVAKVLANPVIATANGRTASFEVGGELPISKQAAAGTAPHRAFVGTRCSVQPVLLDPNRLRLDLRVEVHSIHPRAAGSVQSTCVDTQLQMRLGETYVVGGMLREAERATVFVVKSERFAAPGEFGCSGD